MSAVAVRPVLEDLVPRFERARGCSVGVSYALNPAAKAQIDTGAAFDVVVINPHFMADLVREGRVLRGSDRPFGRAGMALAVRRGAPVPDLGSLEAFRRTLLDAPSIAFAGEGSSGAYFRGLLERLGLGERLAPKLLPVERTGEAVATGAAACGVAPITTLLATPGLEVAGFFPSELQSYIDFAAGVSAASADHDAAQALVQFLAAPQNDAAVRARGLERCG